MVNERKISLKQQAYAKIKQAIIVGDFRANQELSENELSEILGMSRTPIREALLQLQAEEFIRIIPHKGAMVRSFGLAEVIEISHVREALEGMAARLACDKVDLAVIRAIKNQFPTLEMLESPEERNVSYETGKSLHTYILETSNNRLIIKTVESLELQFQRVMHLASEVPGRHQNALMEHLRIVEALERRDPDDAERSMREHIRNVLNGLGSAISAGRL